MTIGERPLSHKDRAVLLSSPAMPDNRYAWVTVREASQRLGRSPETIRRQAKDGTLEHPWEWAPRSRSDPRLQILVGFPRSETTPREPSATPHDAIAATDALRAVVDAHQAEVAALRAQHATERERDATRRASLEREVAQLDETAMLLAADAVEASRRADALAAENAALAAQLARRRRWWW